MSFKMWYDLVGDFCCEYALAIHGKDPFFVRILDILYKEPLLSAREIAEMEGLDEWLVRSKIEQLRELGLIIGYTPTKAGRRYLRMCMDP